jgi:hypothetical protein
MQRAVKLMDMQEGCQEKVAEAAPGTDRDLEKMEGQEDALACLGRR